MERKKILLVCGAGMSSGFLATSTRKAAKKRKLDYSIHARSESEVVSHLSSIDCLLLGPHYATHESDFRKQSEPYNIPVAVIPQDIYGMLDGEKLLDYAISIMEG